MIRIHSAEQWMHTAVTLPLLHGNGASIIHRRPAWEAFWRMGTDGREKIRPQRKRRALTNDPLRLRKGVAVGELLRQQWLRRATGLPQTHN